MPEAVRPAVLPEALPGLDAPFAYSWGASQRVAVVAGAQNLPFYPHFQSEEDHRHALEAARVGGERLLKALRDGRYNARPEYGEALEFYLDDLPKTAGAGNILIANDQVRILHAMFLADAAMLPEGFASRLKSVIANQFALNAFYDLVQRHNEAVGAGNWSRPFPLDAAKGFFGAVEDNTPRWFEREVNEGLRRVEQAEPPAAATPSRRLRRPSSRRRFRRGRLTRRTRGGGRWRRRRTRCGRRSCKGARCRWRRTNGARRRRSLESTSGRSLISCGRRRRSSASPACWRRAYPGAKSRGWREAPDEWPAPFALTRRLRQDPLPQAGEALRRRGCGR